MTEVDFKAQSVREILVNSKLNIPDYQRPYKWQRKHIKNLFYDIMEIVKEPCRKSYHIGSLILHRRDNRLDIVDGQQRLISMSLFLHAIGELDNYLGAKNLLEQPFGETSCQQAQDNFQEWQHLIEGNEAEKIDSFKGLLLNHCYLSVIVLSEEGLPEAFQLFDSQNNRGKSLEPHDLLKAFHLRSITSEEQTEEMIAHWESIVQDDKLNLKDLFDKHLFRIRRWSNGETGLTQMRYSSYLKFTEGFIDDFKGVDLSSDNNYPYLQIYRLLKKGSQDFPKSLTMPIINGTEFFDYIKISQSRLLEVQSSIETYKTSNIKKILNQKSNKFQRPKNLFYNILALFIDRFGELELSQEVFETLLIWSYYPRKATRVMDATLANYAAGGRFQQKDTQRLFQVLNQSLTPNDFLLKIDRDKFENWNLETLIQEVIEK